MHHTKGASISRSQLPSAPRTALQMGLTAHGCVQREAVLQVMQQLGWLFRAA